MATDLPQPHLAHGNVEGRSVEGRSVGGAVHQLRHFYASALLRAGESVKTVQAALEHASDVETLQIYVGLWPDNAQRTRAAIDAPRLGEPSSPATPHTDTPK